MSGVPSARDQALHWRQAEAELRSMASQEADTARAIATEERADVAQRIAEAAGREHVERTLTEQRDHATEWEAGPVMARTPQQEAWMAGYTRGVQSGYDVGYAEGVAALDDAAAAVAQMKPSQSVGVKERRDSYAEPAHSADEIRTQAARSWGLADPEAVRDAGRDRPRTAGRTAR